MSNLREKAQEIKAAGEAERGNFTPSGVPLRLYNYWLDVSSSKKAEAIRTGSRRENFCHFWRVVVLWSWLNFIKVTAVKVVATKTFAIVAGLAFVLAFFAILTTAGALIPFLLTAAAITAIVGIGFGLAWLHDRFWKSEWNHTTGKVFAGIGIFLFAAYIIAMIIAGVVEWGWTFLLWILAGLVALSFVVFVLATLSTFISGRRALRREKRRKAEDEAWEKYLDEDGPMPGQSPPRQPGILSKFFSGLADFLILATQIVRVKKWKICPMVEIDSAR